MKRRPMASVQSGGIPTLAALLAAGAELAGCVEPMCQSNRAAELEVHGRVAVAQGRNAQGSEALRSLGVGAGVVIHPRAPSQQPVDVDGGIGMVDPALTPEPPPEPPPVPSSQNILGGIRPATALPPTHGTPTVPAVPRVVPRPRAPTPPRHFEPHRVGDMGAVMAVPPGPLGPPGVTRRLV